MKKIFLTAFLLLFTTSCSSQQFRMSEKQARAVPQYETSQPFFVYGIGQTREVNTSDICDGDHKVSEVKNTLAPLDILINIVQSVLTIVQVYSPRSTSVTCK